MQETCLHISVLRDFLGSNIEAGREAFIRKKRKLFCVLPKVGGTPPPIARFTQKLKVTFITLRVVVLCFLHKAIFSEV